MLPEESVQSHLALFFVLSVCFCLFACFSFITANMEGNFPEAENIEPIHPPLQLRAIAVSMSSENGCFPDLFFKPALKFWSGSAALKLAWQLTDTLRGAAYCHPVTVTSKLNQTDYKDPRIWVTRPSQKKPTKHLLAGTSEGLQTLPSGQTRDKTIIRIWTVTHWGFLPGSARTPEIALFTTSLAGGDMELATSDWSGPYRVFTTWILRTRRFFRLSLWCTVLPQLDQQDDFPSALFKW